MFRILFGLALVSAVAFADARPVPDEVADGQLLVAALAVEEQAVAPYQTTKVEYPASYLTQHIEARDKLKKALAKIKQPTEFRTPGAVPKTLVEQEMAVVREIGGTAHLYQDSDLRALATSLAIAAATRFGALSAQ